ncbi:stage II sporulation protein P [Paenibacillus sp. CMAA1364]
MKKEWFQIWNLHLWRAKWLSVLTMGRTFMILMMSSIIFFIMLGLGGIAEQSFNTSPISSMKGFASSLTSDLFKDMLAMEMPHLNKDKESSSLSAEKMSTFVFQLLTNVNIRDPKSLLAKELPGMDRNNPVLLRSATGNKNMEAPEDYHPDSSKAVASAKAQEGIAIPDPITMANEITKPEEPLEPKDELQDRNGEILIYHSHPREAFNPLIGTPSTNPSSAKSSENVMQVGSMIATQLKVKGIATKHLQDDYPSYMKDYSYKFSYKYSRESIKKAMAQNDKLTYFLDIHRDSQRHDKTTTTINNVSYAQMYFIIGHENKNWRQNEAYANSIHQRLEATYPGISRGIWGKTANQGNGEYNQSLSPNSIIIEIGGIDNTKEELERTSRILADILADVYFEDQNAKKANAVKSEVNTTNGS